MVESSTKKYGKSKLQISSAVTGGDEKKAAKAQKELNKSVDNVVKSFKAEEKAVKKAGKGIETLKEQTADSAKNINKLGSTTNSWSQTVVGAASAAMSLSFALSSITSLGTTWADENIGVGEKLLQTFMSLGMAIPMVANGVKGLTSTF